MQMNTICALGVRRFPDTMKGPSAVCCSQAKSLDAGRDLTAMVLEAVSKALKRPVEDIDQTESLVGQGMTSLLAIRLSMSLSTMLETKLPPTLAFTYPTTRQLVSHLTARTSAPIPPTASTPLELAEVVTSSQSGLHEVAITGSRVTIASCPLPHCRDDLHGRARFERVIVGGAADADAHWLDNETAVPSAARVFSLQGAEGFDHSLFGLPSAEARVMDPQQRILLECSMSALHTRTPTETVGSTTGVFLAMWSSEFSEVLWTTPLGMSAFAAMAVGCSCYRKAPSSGGGARGRLGGGRGSTASTQCEAGHSDRRSQGHCFFSTEQG